MLAAAPAASSCGTHVNTSFVERQNGTGRNRNGRKVRKVRKTCCFSKDRGVHAAVTSFTVCCYNFCRPARTLASKREGGTKAPCTPAMAAGLADHVWTLAEWLSGSPSPPPAFSLNGARGAGLI